MQRPGDHSLEQLCKASREKAFRYACRLARNRDDAEDLVQDALLRAAKALPGSDRLANPEAWLCTAVRNAFIDKHRAAKVRPVLTSLNSAIEDNPGFEPAWDGPTPEQAVLGREMSPAVEEVFAALTDRERAAILDSVEDSASPRTRARRQKSGTIPSAVRRRFLQTMRGLGLAGKGLFPQEATA